MITLEIIQNFIVTSYVLILIGVITSFIYLHLNEGDLT